mmetsp:Transcript_23669/g.33069  ORF Transcript_23669/g.33069 Transcript_23669/m.33069 type:complete len:134 (+) Transcript_23669:2657-3058(+)
MQVRMKRLTWSQTQWLSSSRVCKSKSRSTKKKTGYYEDEAKRQNNTINRLEKEREALNNAIKQLKTQLEEQRHRIMQQKKLREQQAAAAEMVNEAVISAEISPREGGPAAVIAEPIEDPDDDEEEDDLGREVI